MYHACPDRQHEDQPQVATRRLDDAVRSRHIQRHTAPFDYVTQFMDFGKDSYAVQFFSGTPWGDNALLLAWAANLQYASLVPTAQEGVAWRGHASGACTACSS